MRTSQNLGADYIFRLSMTAVAMALPFIVTFFLALADRSPAVGVMKKANLKTELYRLTAIRSPGWRSVQTGGSYHEVEESSLVLPPQGLKQLRQSVQVSGGSSDGNR